MTDHAPTTIDLDWVRFVLFAGIQDPDLRDPVWELLDDLRASAGAFEHSYRVEIGCKPLALCSRCGLAERAPCHEVPA